MSIPNGRANREIIATIVPPRERIDLSLATRAVGWGEKRGKGKKEKNKKIERGENLKGECYLDRRSDIFGCANGEFCVFCALVEDALQLPSGTSPWT